VFPGLALLAFRMDRWRWVVLAALTAIAALSDPHPLFWGSFAVGGCVALSVLPGRGARRHEPFLSAWVAAFFAVAIVLFFAGSARYLLPIAAPVAMLVVRTLHHKPAWLAAGIVLQFGVSLALARSHYEHSNGYRTFVQEMQPRFAGANVWVNGEWGLQYYGQAAGGRPMLRGQDVRPGDWIVSNRLGFPVPYRAVGGKVETVAEHAITPSLPVRVIGLGSRSAFSTISFGVRPFDFSTAPADVLRAERVAERAITREYLEMNDSEAGVHIVDGLYGLEAGQWRWTAARAEVVLRRPPGAARLEARVFVPDTAPARAVTLAVEGAEVARVALPGPGLHTVASDPRAGEEGIVTVTLAVDRAFTPPGDRRTLGVILHGIGFRR
jgi:hypothetical protein